MTTGPMCAVLFGNPAGFDVRSVWLCQALAILVPEVLGIAAWRRIAPIWDRGRLVVGSLIAVAAGAALFVGSVTSVLPLGTVGVYAGAILVGLATPSAWWWWGELSSSLPPRAMGMVVPASTILATVLLAGLRLLATLSTMLATLVLLVVASIPVAMATISVRAYPNAESAEVVAANVSYTPSLRFLAGLFVYSVAYYGAVVLVNVGASQGLVPWLVGPAVGALMVLVIFVFDKGPALSLIQGMLLPLTVICLSVIPVAMGTGPTAFGVTLFGFVYFQTLVLVTYMYIIGRAEVSGSSVLMWGSVALYSGQIVGGLCGISLGGAIELGDAWPIVAAFALVACAFASTFLLSERHVLSCWGSAGISAEADRNAWSLPDEAAAAYGLTPREVEVTRCLLEGMTADDVARELVISPATAKTHIHRVYEKVGVHSQVELLVVVSKLKRGDSSDAVVKR